MDQDKDLINPATDRFRGNSNRRRGWWKGQGHGRRQNNWQGRRQTSYSEATNRSQPSQGSIHPVFGNKATHTQTSLQIASPYKGWQIYYPETAYSEHSPIVKQVQLFEKYFISWNKLFDWEQIEIKGSFCMDFKELSADPIIIEGFPDIAQELKNAPEKVLNSMGLAVHQIVSHCHEGSSRSDHEMLEHSHHKELAYVGPFIQARIMNSFSPLALKNFKANIYGKFVCVKGTVVRVSNIKPLCMKMAFQCVSCAFIQALPFPDGKYKLPTKCPEKNCSGRSFLPCRTHALTETVDWQNIRLQEVMSNDQKDMGRIPRTIDCELTKDLVDSCVPGDIVTISGIVKVHSIDEGGQKNKDKCMFLLYLDGNHVDNAKGSKAKREDEGQGPGLAMDFSMKELYAIQEIHAQNQLFPLLVASLCPSIFGHEMVKAGLLLGLFGGSQKYKNDKNHIPVRGDPHILVVGDPGLGKSQMLQAAAYMAPRSVYVCGNTTTTSGLTITLSKEGGSGDFALEAGALVLADQGCCCIDEFDKMGSQHQALLEAMEQQSISIAKAGIVCSLPARTSILAAANPVGGHYNKGKTVSENLKLGGALLSRFDLVFIMIDKPDDEMDCVLSEHIMALHSGNKSLQTSVLDWQKNISNSRRHTNSAEEKPLVECLKMARSEVTDPIPYQLFRKYVGYARKYVHPKVGKDAVHIIQEFYLKLRRQHQNRDSTPITTRQLESLIRLTEARARLELREEATGADAQDVVELMNYCMQNVYSDQFGLLDFQRSQHGSGMSGRSLPKHFISALQRVAETTYNNIFTVHQMRQIMKDIGMHIPDMETFVSSLNNQGFLLKKGNKVYQLQTFS